LSPHVSFTLPTNRTGGGRLSFEQNQPNETKGNKSMDPITAAIVAAVAAGAAKVGGQAVADAYAGLKALLKRKFGADSKVVKATEEVEANPESKSRPAILSEEVMAAKADQDSEILKAAEALLAKLKDTPGGQTVITMHISGGERHNIAGRDLYQKPD
jgi:hypothetical protein